jgi:hypothetical protein
MINEGWVTSSLLGTAKGVGFVGKNVAKGMANTVSRGVYHLANTKIGGATLATGAGLYLANRLIKKRKDSNNTKTNNLPTQKRKADFQKRKKKIFEMNRNLPGLPTLASNPNKIKVRKNIVVSKNSKSVVSYLNKNPNKYRPKAAEPNISLQVKSGQQNMKKTKAITGYDKTLGKISKV